MTRARKRSESEVDIDRLFETGTNAMLSSLDPFSSYENPVEAEDLAIRTTGSSGPPPGTTYGSFLSLHHRNIGFLPGPANLRYRV